MLLLSLPLKLFSSSQRVSRFVCVRLEIHFVEVRFFLTPVLVDLSRQADLILLRPCLVILYLSPFSSSPVPRVVLLTAALFEVYISFTFLKTRRGVPELTD